MDTAAAPLVELVNGARMPQLGLGTWPLDDADVEVAVRRALDSGYRLVDTAENYDNEVGVGRGIAGSAVAREDIFVTTKFNRRWHSVDGARRAFEASAERLGVDYIDLLLIHWPNPEQDRYVEAFAGLVELLRQGRVRAIGTSNFKPAHLDRIVSETGVVPDVNQIQLHPRATRAGLREFHAGYGILTESWSPIGRGGDLLEEPVIAELARRYGRTPAQIVLRWHVELGLAVVPKSADAQRIGQNIDVFDFALDSDDIARLSALDSGEEPAPDSDVFGH
ncbi:2,5-diketo-D-gluconate reductase A [Halopolyspora algeriensis]|uniref:2,5-diketo-D-gluconate reductase A n=1 Tax=Halopolyspora algeriensis TaxID=1500506 RepID=A0A368VTI2_9ACTN|nr:aldo/keto reductase [Halopolyspora algeriensis]RCW44506.1 2,5-diketo-D-gluconate reductase A [Halopolyspora algeriensis]TQM55866.1 2,5-diketo-D-gluconate reductase A [Halopolyspora algeriensis]